MKVHYTEKYILNPAHKVTVNLVGLGGTGSQMLSSLARLSKTLNALSHPGLHVRAWDPDIVTDANINRQLFYEPDIGNNKALVLVSRVNRALGLDWEAQPSLYQSKNTANILISCTDTPESRVQIAEEMVIRKTGEARDRTFYWLDMGNSKKTGQVVLGTVIPIVQPKGVNKVAEKLPNVIQRFPQIKRMKDKDQGPSCSLAEAIGKQDLYINSAMALYGGVLLWKLFREGMINHHGCFVNLDTCQTNPIPIK